MTDVMFYHLDRQPLERVLPQLIARTIERGWRAVIQTESEERAEAISAVLWTFSEEGFLPHGTARDGHGPHQPVWITPAEDNPNGASVRFFVGGAAPLSYDGLDRAVLLFDGQDSDAVEQARGLWKTAKAAGHAVSYWQQDESGRWSDKAAQGANS
jgi:DNA polymerase III subunit chi